MNWIQVYRVRTNKRDPLFVLVVGNDPTRLGIYLAETLPAGERAVEVSSVGTVINAPAAFILDEYEERRRQAKEGK